MTAVILQTVHPRTLAAVRREVAVGTVGSAWRGPLDQVWAFIRSQPGLWADGQNVFLYEHPTRPEDPIVCHFGVEVTRSFDAAGEVSAIQTPEGEAAVAVHRGPYDLLSVTHEAVQEWIAANGRADAGWSWEIYGDPTPDPADTETTVAYLLAPG